MVAKKYVKDNHRISISYSKLTAIFDLMSIVNIENMCLLEYVLLLLCSNYEYNNLKMMPPSIFKLIVSVQLLKISYEFESRPR